MASQETLHQTTAFEKYFASKFGSDTEGGIRELTYMIANGSVLAFEYLEATGDRPYNSDTFRKAVELIVERGDTEK